MDIYRRLVIGGRREYLFAGGRNGGVAVDDFGKYAAQGFNAQRQRRYVQQQYVFYFPCQYTGLNGGANGYTFVRVHVAGRFFAHDSFNGFLYRRNTGRTAYQNDLIDLIGRKTGIA